MKQYVYYAVDYFDVYTKKRAYEYVENKRHAISRARQLNVQTQMPTYVFGLQIINPKMKPVITTKIKNFNQKIKL